MTSLASVASRRTAQAYSAAMLLSACGDAMGYKNGEWEFCFDGSRLHAAVERMGGLTKLNITLPHFRVSDDTVMHMATAKALIAKTTAPDEEQLYLQLAKEYCDCMNYMAGRSPGDCTSFSCNDLIDTGGYKIEFNDRGGGCGGAMRSMCIGMVFWQPHQLKRLVSTAVEAGRMTHNHPTGYLGSLASAYFASLALQGQPLEKWGAELLQTALPAAWKYVEETGRDLAENKRHWPYFSTAWANYLRQRGLLDGRGPAQFKQPYGPAERDAFYKSLSYSGWGGASGHDAPMIAYDALLFACGAGSSGGGDEGSGEQWLRLCEAAVLHGGDNDSTGAIACCLYGLLNGGLEGVPDGHHSGLEFRSELASLGEQLHQVSEQL
uniref:ADP-ribosylhydrolase ARH1 n=2 Tax=Macrostomum lignano TaxID=282301 RepID=A0A1I8H8F4_9PLAT